MGNNGLHNLDMEIHTFPAPCYTKIKNINSHIENEFRIFIQHLSIRAQGTKLPSSHPILSSSVFCTEIKDRGTVKHAHNACARTQTAHAPAACAYTQRKAFHQAFFSSSPPGVSVVRDPEEFHSHMNQISYRLESLWREGSIKKSQAGHYHELKVSD